jgi:hypothetical protein
VKQALPIVLVVVLVAVGLVLRGEGLREPQPAAPAEAVAPSEPGSVRTIVAGGGPVPELNQVSIELDLALAVSVLGPARLLFAGGPGTDGVQVLDESPRGDELVARLAGIFAPKGGRDSHYRPTVLIPEGPATTEGVLAAIDEATAGPGDEPALIYLAGHGDRGATPRESAFLTWGDGDVDAVDLALALDRAPSGRRVRLVVTSCYSGGFAEVAFRAADPALGATPKDRCGLFASTWDEEASGCDPNPDRRVHEGYGLHFLNALRGLDRGGEKLGGLDLDDDGRISLLEAHTRARIASGSLGVPTTTSERFLRAVAPSKGPKAVVSLPEEDAVVGALGKRLGLQRREGLAAERLADLEDAAEEVQRRLEQAQQAEQEAYRKVAARLLARWPVLDDPWHPDFRTTLERDRRELTSALESLPEVAALDAAQKATDAVAAELDGLRLKAAPYERLARAFENRELAARLKARGGADWERYERMLACERSLP